MKVLLEESQVRFGFDYQITLAEGVWWCEETQIPEGEDYKRRPFVHIEGESVTQLEAFDLMAKLVTVGMLLRAP